MISELIRAERLERYYSEALECYRFYVEENMSFRQVSREMGLHPMTIRNRLLLLEDIDIDKYEDYKLIAKKRNYRNGKV